MDMNIPIRTTLCARNEMRFYAGGGIVADSTPEDEFEETETKIAAIRRAVAALHAERGPETAAEGGLRKETIARRDALATRGALAPRAGVVAKITRLPEYLAARSVLTTMAIGSEWNTRSW
jgi:hypothetical protein